MVGQGISLRRARPGDESLLRELRLVALADAPEAFDSTLERERERSDEQWGRWVTRSCVVIAEADGEPVGIASGVPDEADETTAYLMSMWVRADHRGSGLAEALIERVVTWGEQSGFARLVLHVGRDNPRARRCYERHGFTETGEKVTGVYNHVVEIGMSRALERRR